MLERVQKILASAGLCSRRKCEELIAKGRVQVNGRIVKLGDKADPEKDLIEVDGRPVKPEKKVYYILYKPRGYVTTLKAQFGQKTIMDLVKIRERVFPVGRLDKDAEGLVLLTNDGGLANRISHPRYEVEKEYLVVLDRPFDKCDILKSGVVVEGRKVFPRKVSVTGRRVLLAIHEGRKHIVKKLFALLGFGVTRLVRVRLATLRLGSLGPGCFRELTKGELRALKSSLDAG